MSWMAPVSRGTVTGQHPTGRVAEHVQHVLPAALQPHQPDAEVGDRVADQVVGAVVGQHQVEHLALAAHRDARRGQPGLDLGTALGDLDDDVLGQRGHRRRRRRAHQAAAVDDDDVVADPLQLTHQVRGDDDGDAEHGADPPDQAQHLVATGRVEAVGRLVQQHQLRVVHQGLGELDPLLHAGRVAADRPVALLEQADVAQRVRGPLAGGVGGQPGHPGEVHDQLGGGDVGRQAVVLGHVAHQLADPLPLGGDVQVEHPRAARGGRQEAEQDLDQRRLAGPVGADQTGHALGDLHVEVGERGDPGAVPLRQRLRDDERRHLGSLAIIPRGPSRLAVSGVCARTLARQPERTAATATARSRSSATRPACCTRATSATAPWRSGTATTGTSRRPSCCSRRSRPAPPPTSTPSPAAGRSRTRSPCRSRRSRCATTTATGCRTSRSPSGSPSRRTRRRRGARGPPGRRAPLARPAVHRGPHGRAGHPGRDPHRGLTCSASPRRAWSSWSGRGPRGSPPGPPRTSLPRRW